MCSHHQNISQGYVSGVPQHLSLDQEIAQRYVSNTPFIRSIITKISSEDCANRNNYFICECVYCYQGRKCFYTCQCLWHRHSRKLRHSPVVLRSLIKVLRSAHFFSFFFFQRSAYIYVSANLLKVTGCKVGMQVILKYLLSKYDSLIRKKYENWNGHKI